MKSLVNILDSGTLKDCYISKIILFVEKKLKSKHVSNNIIFVCAGSGRSEILVLMKLYKKKWKFGHVIFIDSIYGSQFQKSAKLRHNLEYVLLQLIGYGVILEYTILSNFTELSNFLEKSLEKYLIESSNKQGCLSKISLNKYNIHLIMSIQYQISYCGKNEQELKLMKKNDELAFNSIYSSFDLMSSLGIKIEKTLINFYKDFRSDKIFQQHITRMGINH